ncbi:hypothetical protein Tco_0001964 [Tanacetum coccineum]
MMTASMGKKANVTPSKKGSITTDDNILPDPDKALNCTQLASDMKKATKASRRAYRIQQQSTGLKGELEILTSDDERTESKREVARSEKADEETTNDKEIHDDEEVHEDEEVHDDDEKHDDNDEMADAEKDNGEKIEEEKVDDEQVGDDQAAKDDQAGALISVTQKEKPKLPPSSFSLSLSYNYGNQFLNVSSDISLVGIVKESAETKINSMLDVPVQQETPLIQQTPLLDVHISVIPEQTTSTPATPPTKTEA